MKKVRVLIVEDSAVVRALLEQIVSDDPRLELAATAGSAEEALRMLEHFTPDVITMDIRLPGMDGLEATRRIMSSRPVPIIVATASVACADRNIVAVEALRAGALTLLEKPVGSTHADYAKLANLLCDQLVMMSQVQLIRQRRTRGPRAEWPAAMPPSVSGRYQMLGIACSTGGPAALAQFLNALGSGFRLPILLVQHMIPSFLPGFAAWLAGVCPLRVAVAEDGRIPSPNTVHVAPAERHLRLLEGRLRLDRAELVCGQRPSGTVLLESMAHSLGNRTLGLVLTGMGDDGASGLLAIRKAGGYTLAEDQSSAVVYGMPAAAVSLGAVCESLPLAAIARRVLELAPQSAEPV
jgi:two-component system chemotaxis response regulator CheB